MANLIILGWPRRKGFIQKLIGEKMEHVLTYTDKTLFICDFQYPLVDHGRILVMAPPFAELEKGFILWTAKISALAQELSTPIVYSCNTETRKAIEKYKQENSINAVYGFEEINGPEDFFTHTGKLKRQDLLILISARKGAISHRTVWTTFLPEQRSIFTRTARLLSTLNRKHMSLDLIITMVIIAIGIFLFVKDYFSIDTTSVLIMALFIVAGVLSPEEGFSGFNHPATITLGCMFIISAGVFQSGLLDGISIKLVRLARTNYFIALLIFCITASVFSAFVNDSAVVALLLPIALKVCRESDISPSKLLIPISFAALFGGTCTLIGTSTNILVSSYAEKYGLEGFGMFEFSLPALCIASVGFAYLLFAGPLLLPKRKSIDSGLSEEAGKYVTEIIIEEDCPDLNKPVFQSRLVKEFNAQVLRIRRQDRNSLI